MTNTSNYYFSRKISITTNLSCNLHCVYCYEKVHSNKSFDLENIKNKLHSYLNTPTSKGTVIDLHGGEPFLIFEKIRQLCDSLWKQTFKENFIIHTTTNGTLVHGTIKNWLQKNRSKFPVKLSLDGCKKAHNLNRCDSFSQIDCDFFAKNWPHEYIKVTVTPLSLPYLAESIAFLHKKFNKIQVNFAELIDWNNPTLLSSYKTQLLKLSQFYLENPHYNRCSLFTLNYSKLLVNSPLHLEKLCANGGKIAFDIDGQETYPCQLVLPTVCGYLKASKFREIMKDTRKLCLISSQCKKCLLHPLCDTCYGANFIARGAVFNRDLNLCSLQKLRIWAITKYDYNKIINQKCNPRTPKNRLNDIITMKGIKKILPVLSQLEEKFENI